MEKVNEMNEMILGKKFVILEDDIAYDWDDYGVWGAVLYDVANKTITTSKYGHGTDLSTSYEEGTEFIHFKDALEKGIITNEEVIESIVRRVVSESKVKESINDYPVGRDINIPCKIEGGRKMKGDAYLLKLVKVNDFKPFGWRGKWDKSHIEGVVAQPSTGKICNINTAYIKIENGYNEFVKRIIDSYVSDGTYAPYLAHVFAYQMSYASCDRYNYTDCVHQIMKRGCSYGQLPTEVVEFIKNDNEMKEKALREEKEKNRPAIVAWANKTLVGKSEDEKNEIIERLVAKGGNWAM